MLRHQTSARDKELPRNLIKLDESARRASMWRLERRVEASKQRRFILDQCSESHIVMHNSGAEIALCGHRKKEDL